ncbi:protein of unknown function [Rhodovastum atsumiense]|nr:protein of unknown function [Rhodovastum atsumiense]
MPQRFRRDTFPRQRHDQSSQQDSNPPGNIAVTAPACMIGVRSTTSHPTPTQVNEGVY